MSPKITAHGGATNARDADVSPAADASQPQAVAEDGLGRPTSDAQEPVTTLQEAMPGDALPEVAESAYTADSVPLPLVKDYESMTLAELREEATGRDVPSYGTKAQIAERLREADTEE
jgi:hypothetical protein